MQFARLAEQAGVEVARRFLRAADLAEMLFTGPVKMHEGKFRGVRLRRVMGFENVLIFYRPLPDGVAIERAFDAKRNYQRVFNELDDDRRGHRPDPFTHRPK